MPRAKANKSAPAANGAADATEAVPIGLNPSDSPTVPETSEAPQTPELIDDPQQLDELFKALKTLLNTVDKLQTARQDVGDIKPLMERMLDGELLSGEELDQLKSGVSSLSKLVKVYGDYQTALEQAQPARELLDTVLKP
ncbi:MAG: PCRF domain-containing protein [Leptolyngbya sp. SIO4C1]|nr:PCRF domain-containing protein [Leptolyngbya sp. SIO4C1]